MNPLALVCRLQAPDPPNVVDGPFGAFVRDCPAIFSNHVLYLASHLPVLELCNRLIPWLLEGSVEIGRLLILHVVENLIKRFRKKAFAAVMEFVVVVPINFVLEIFLSEDL